MGVYVHYHTLPMGSKIESTLNWSTGEEEEYYKAKFEGWVSMISSILIYLRTE